MTHINVYVSAVCRNVKAAVRYTFLTKISVK